MRASGLPGTSRPPRSSLRRAIFALLLPLAVCTGMFGPVAHGQVPQLDPERFSGAIARQANNRVFPPARRIVALESGVAASATEQRLVERAARIVAANATTALLMIDGHRIVFERYKAPADVDSPLFSQSMSKSLTAMTIGALLCKGAIASLDDPAHRYAPQIAGTAAGDATIRNLLRMGSGVAPALMAGAHLPGEWRRVVDGELSTIDVIRHAGGQDVPQGTRFTYSATDPFALALAGNGAGGFFEAFERDVWQAAGASRPGYWLSDRLGNPASAAGFSASARDWGRLAMFAIEQLRHGSACMRAFMRDATSAQFGLRSQRAGQPFHAYGYQMWLADSGGRPSVWWAGYGGQRVGFDPQSGKVLVLTSWRADYMAEVYALFEDWVAH